MVTAQVFPNRIQHIHLLAPDGISTHFSYRFSTYPLLFRKLFKSQIKKPAVFKLTTRLVKFLGLLDSYSVRFAETQMDTEEKREQVYYSWVVLRHFFPDLKALASMVNSTDIKLTFYLGKYDRVINKKQIAPLVAKLEMPKIIEINSGHSKMIDSLSILGLD